MREQKWRAWDTKYRCWNYFTLTDLIIGRANDTALQYENWCEWTGLHDSNGKEIYENDILRVHNWSINNNDVIGVAKVFWDSEECGWRILPSLYIEDWYDLIAKAIPRSEIIGNIHSNPELLNE